MPLDTLNAYRDQGQPRPTFDRDVSAAYQALRDLGTLGIDLGVITRQLEDEGVATFVAAFDRLMAALQAKRAGVIEQPAQAVGR